MSAILVVVQDYGLGPVRSKPVPDGGTATQPYVTRRDTMQLGLLREKRAMAIPEGAFRGYVAGGRRWPQKRCATNIFLLHSLLVDSSGANVAPLLEAILRSDPSPIQLRQLGTITEGMHRQADLSVCVSDAQFKKEWYATKAYAVRALIAYCCGTTSQLYQSDVSTFGAETFGNLVSDLLAALTEQERHRLRACVLSAHNAIGRERRLSGLYRLTFYSRSALDSIRPGNFLNDVMGSIDIDEFYEHRNLYRHSILMRVGFSINRSIIQETSPSANAEWLTIGFFAN